MSPLLDQALDLDPAARGRFLRPACTRAASCRRARGTDRLARRVRRTPTSFGHCPARRSRRLGGNRGRAPAPETPLGVGGMGTVWRARRSDGRFEGPWRRQAAPSRHPEPRERRGSPGRARCSPACHIRISRGSSTLASPRPVSPISYSSSLTASGSIAWADEARLGMTERLRLLQHVAEAVAYAHAHLVVHRDLKPSNILVTPGGAGEAARLRHRHARWVAKARRASRRSRERHDARVRVPGTDPRAEAATTAADVYALGVILYGLLTGLHPTDPRRCRAARRRPIDPRTGTTTAERHLRAGRSRP